MKKEYETFFFFPFYHTGGAEKVHALVAQATGNSRCIIYFTRRSADKKFYKDFERSGCVIKDISKYTDNKAFYFLNLICRGIITTHINAQKQAPLVFNGQCNFGYKISPWVNPRIPQVELLHSFNTFSWIRIPFIPFINHTVMISKVRIEEHLQQYKKLQIPIEFNSKIQHIVNGIPLPTANAGKDYLHTIRVLYAGRGTEEKRVYLIAQIAEQALLKQLPVEFVFMGDLAQAIPKYLLQYSKLLGHVEDDKMIEQAYQEAHIAIITSYTEGFPLVIEEGMSRGCAVIATPVGDIPVHVKHNQNGFLFSVVNDETSIVNEGIQFLSLLCSDRMLLQKMSDANTKYAVAHFSIEAFNMQYQKLFHHLRSSIS